MSNALRFGATLRLLRLDAGISLRGLAEQIGVSSAYLSRVETGRDAVPTPDRLARIAEILGLPAAVMLDLANKVTPFVAAYLEEVPAAAALFLAIAQRRLTEAQLLRVHAFIDAELPRVPVRSRGRVPPLSELLTAERVVPGLMCTELEDAIDIAASRLLLPGDPWTAGQLAAALLAREREAATALGGGVTVPHARLPGATPRAALVILATPLPATTPDGEPLRLLIALITPTEEPRALHLERLAQVARLARSSQIGTLCASRQAGAALARLMEMER